MIKLQICNIDEIAKEFTKRIEESIVKNKFSETEKKHLGGNSFSKGNILQKRIFKLYLCKPELLKKESADFETYLHDNFTNIQRKNIVSKYFDYKNVLNYKQEGISNAYWLMQKLNIRVCPYCNRSFTFTIRRGETGSRPEFDHFNSQDNYPYLSLSFYNLIPSCPICNHKKSTSEIDINPYLEDFGDRCRFQIDNIERCLLLSNYKEWNIYMDKIGNKYDNNINIFLLCEFYNEHKDYISEIVFKARAYTSGYYENLVNTFHNQGLTEREMNLLIFGCYFESQDLNLRPLSKLTRDVVEQVGIKIF